MNHWKPARVLTTAAALFAVVLAGCSTELHVRKYGETLPVCETGCPICQKAIDDTQQSEMEWRERSAAAWAATVDQWQRSTGHRTPMRLLCMDCERQAEDGEVFYTADGICRECLEHRWEASRAERAKNKTLADETAKWNDQ